MSNTALFVDLPNFLSGLLKSGIESPRFLRDYVRFWLDFDLLARSLTESHMGIWIFYSGERIGPSGERIDGKYLQEYIRRINTLQGVTAHNVNIPGEQREPSSYKCDQCGHEGVSESVSEKGIDSSLTVHLFDTMDSWDTAFLLSGDADFVPVIASLRRRGKIVIGVGFSNASEALVRECYHYINIVDLFLKQDILAYNLFKKDGVVQKWLCDEIKQDPAKSPSPNIKLKLFLGPERHFYKGTDIPPLTSSYFITLGFMGSIDLAKRHKMISELQYKYNNQIEVEMEKEEISSCQISGIPILELEAIKRHLNSNIFCIPGLEISESGDEELDFSTNYNLNEITGNFDQVIEVPAQQ